MICPSYSGSHWLEKGKVFFICFAHSCLFVSGTNAKESFLQTEMTKSAVPAGWALAEPVKEPVEDSTVIIEVGAYRVKASADTDMELLAKVCRMLVSLC